MSDKKKFCERCGDKTEFLVKGLCGSCGSFIEQCKRDEHSRDYDIKHKIGIFRSD